MFSRTRRELKRKQAKERESTDRLKSGWFSKGLSPQDCAFRCIFLVNESDKKYLCGDLAGNWFGLRTENSCWRSFPSLGYVCSGNKDSVDSEASSPRTSCTDRPANENDAKSFPAQPDEFRIRNWDTSTGRTMYLLLANKISHLLHDLLLSLLVSHKIILSVRISLVHLPSR